MIIFRWQINKQPELCFVGLSLVLRGHPVKAGIMRHINIEAADMQLVPAWKVRVWHYRVWIINLFFLLKPTCTVKSKSL